MRIMSRSVRMPTGFSSWTTTTDPTCRSRMRAAASASVSSGVAVITGVLMSSATVGALDPSVMSDVPSRRLPPREVYVSALRVRCAMTARAGSEPRCPRQRLAGGDRRRAALELVGQGVVERQAPLLVARSPVAPQAQLRKPRELVRELDGTVERPARIGDPVREPHGERLVARHAAAGEDHVEGAAVPDEAGEPHGAAVDQRDAPPSAVHPEHRVPCGDAQVTPQRELEPAGDGVTLDGGDDRLVEQHARRPHGPVAVRGRPIAPAGRDGLEVRAGAERAPGAGEHGHRAVVVAAEGAERLGQSLRRRAIDRVADLRTVDGHDDDAIIVIDAYRAHAVSSLASRVATRCAISLRLTTDRSPVRAAAMRLIDVYSGWNHRCRSRPSSAARYTLMTPPWQTVATVPPGKRSTIASMHGTMRARN